MQGTRTGCLSVTEIWQVTLIPNTVKTSEGGFLGWLEMADDLP